MTDLSNSANTHQNTGFDGKHEAAEAALALVKSARREICFLGSKLDAALLDSPAIIECLKQLCIRSHRTQIRLLVDETQSSIVNSHRSLPLIARLTSAITVRILSEAYQRPKNLLLLADHFGYLRCLNNHRYQGQVNLHDPMMARELRQHFEECWDQGTADPATRRLHL